jgi:hypothetical protein
MNIKIKNSGSMLSMLNGKPIVHKDYIVDVDSNREKGKKIMGMFNDNGIVNKIEEDTLQGYMKKMSSKNLSLFDILKQEHGLVNKALTIPKKMATLVSATLKPATLKPATLVPATLVPKKLFGSKSKEKTKKRALPYNGISSKLFNFSALNAIAETAPNPNPIINPKLSHKMHTRKKRRRNRTHKRKRAKK